MKLGMGALPRADPAASVLHKLEQPKALAQLGPAQASSSRRGAQAADKPVLSVAMKG